MSFRGQGILIFTSRVADVLLKDLISFQGILIFSSNIAEVLSTALISFQGILIFTSRVDEVSSKPRAEILKTRSV